MAFCLNEGKPGATGGQLGPKQGLAWHLPSISHTWLSDPEQLHLTHHLRFPLKFPKMSPQAVLAGDSKHVAIRRLCMMQHRGPTNTWPSDWSHRHGIGMILSAAREVISQAPLLSLASCTCQHSLCTKMVVVAGARCHPQCSTATPVTEVCNGTWESEPSRQAPISSSMLSSGTGQTGAVWEKFKIQGLVRPAASVEAEPEARQTVSGGA